MYRTYGMNTKLLLCFLAGLLWSCKQNTKTLKPKIEEVQLPTQSATKLPVIIKDLMQFTGQTYSDTTNIDNIMVFKKIDMNGTVNHITMEKAVELYKSMTQRRQVNSWPIFEIKNMETVILPLQGIGFGGAIWAKVLVDKKLMEIKKVAFEHQAESEGYGAAFSQSNFEDHFIGMKINHEEDNFRLKKAMKKIQDGGNIIDGNSGATMTSQGAVEMMNLGLQKYASYFKAE